MAAICLLAAVALFVAGFFFKLVGADWLSARLVLLAFVAVCGAWLGVLLTGSLDRMPGDRWR